MKKITKREMYNDLIAYFKGEIAGIDEDAVIEFAEKQIKQLDKKAEAAKKAAEKKKAEGDALTDAVAAVLTDEFASIADITAAVAGDDETITAPKVTYRLAKMVREGIAEKQQITVEGVDGQKARKVQGYRIAE